MSRLFQAASAVAVALTAATAILITVPGMAQNRPGDVVFEPAAPVLAAAPATSATSPVVDNGSSGPDISNAAAAAIGSDADGRRARADSLHQAIAAVEGQGIADADHRCLAAGIYYESQGEPLEGQLAVAHVIINRMQSGRFATTACGVLTQRGQFSFVRNGVVPTPPQNQSWLTALSIARVAMDNSWRNPAPGAMYFHAARVSPRWNRPRVARLGQHIFYR